MEFSRGPLGTGAERAGVWGRRSRAGGLRASPPAARSRPGARGGGGAALSVPAGTRTPVPARPPGVRSRGGFLMWVPRCLVSLLQAAQVVRAAPEVGIAEERKVEELGGGEGWVCGGRGALVFSPTLT